MLYCPSRKHQCGDIGQVYIEGNKKKREQRKKEREGERKMAAVKLLVRRARFTVSISTFSPLRIDGGVSSFSLTSILRELSTVLASLPTAFHPGPHWSLVDAGVSLTAGGSGCPSPNAESRISSASPSRAVTSTSWREARRESEREKKKG